jgi:hypothetical protein
MKIKKQDRPMKRIRLLLFYLGLPFLLYSQPQNNMVSGISYCSHNPFYFAWDGIPVFLLGATGYHSWTPISRPDEVDIVEQLGRLAKVIGGIGSLNVCGFVRCLPYDPMNHLHDGAVKKVLQPWMKMEDGRYDLSRFEPAWEARLIEYLTVALKHRIVVSLEIWDDWSVTRGPGGAYDPGENYGWNGHPFNPENNINYEEAVLPAETAACNAPFYNTIGREVDDNPVLRLQEKYVDKLISIAKAYSNVILNISNESRAGTEWSRYWAIYLRERLPSRFLTGDMPSTNRKDGGGECDYELSPLNLSSDTIYDFVDVSQGVSGHELGEPFRQAIEGGKRISVYRKAMADAGKVRPIVVSKDYTRDAAGGDLVLWSRFMSGTASARFHRPAGDSPVSVVDFQHNAIGRLGRFIAEVPFWQLQSSPQMIIGLHGDAGANVLSDNASLCLIQLAGISSGSTMQLQLPSGRWRMKWINPSSGDEINCPDIIADASAVIIDIPAGSDHMVAVLKNLTQQN